MRRVAASLAIALAACAGEHEPPLAPASILAAASTDAPGALIERVKADLAAHLRVPVETLTVVEQVRVTWPDAGMGCVAPRGVHEPTPIEGFRIVLGWRGRTFRYHADRSGRFVQCPEVAKPLGPIQ